MIEDKVDESITTVNKDHDQKYDKVVKLLEVYEQQLEEYKINNKVKYEKTNLRLEKLQEILGELTCQQSSWQQK